MRGFRHVGIVVKDMERALYFYRDLLGFKVVKQMEEAGDYIDTICGMKNIEVTTIKLAADDGNLIELLHFHLPLSANVKTKNLNDLGFSHISCTVENIDSEYKRLKRAGIWFSSSPQISSDGYVKVVFCRDPEDNFIELVEVVEGR